MFKILAFLSLLLLTGCYVAAGTPGYYGSDVGVSVAPAPVYVAPHPNYGYHYYNGQYYR